MSHDPRSKFQKNFIFPNSAFNIGKSCKISSRMLSTSEVISQKAHGGVENTPPPVLLGLSFGNFITGLTVTLHCVHVVKIQSLLYIFPALPVIY